MDHSDMIKQNLEILGLDSLETLSLFQLLVAVNQSLPSDVSEKRVLNIYVMWLHHRLMAIDISEEVMDEITAWYWCLKELGNDDRLIAEAFLDWQRVQIIDEPTSSRRLSIAEAELRRLMPAWFSRLEDDPEIARPEHYGQMHPDRMRLSQATHSAIELDDEGPEVIVIPSDTPPRNGDQSPGSDENGRSDLSFLTGPNRLVTSDLADSPPYEKHVEVPHTSIKSVPTISLTSQMVKSRSKATGGLNKSTSGYVCDRCEVPGHLLQQCPTNMDPEFDREPPESYVCKICKKGGDHFIQLCPKNQDPNSIVQKRRRATKYNSRTDADRLVEYNLDFWDDRGPRFQDGSSQYNDRHGDRYRGRSHSRSPLRQTSSKRRRDEFIPDSEWATDQPTPSRNSLGKRKTLSKTPPNDFAPQKKIRAQDNEDAKKVTRKVAFIDLVDITPKKEGRLSYHDEYDEEEPATPLAIGTTRSWGDEKMDVDTLEVPASKKSEELDRAVMDLSFRDGLLEMIKTESAQTDLLLLVNGIEFSRTYSTCVAELLRDKHVWVNDTIYTRSCPANFFGPTLDGEQIARWKIEWEMAVEKRVAGKWARNHASAEEETADRATNAEPANSTGVGVKEDTTMDDAESVAYVAGSKEEVKLMTVATEGLQFDETLSNEEHKEGTDAMSVMANLSDESPTENGVLEPAHDITDEESARSTEYNISYVESFASEAVDCKTTEVHLPQPAEDATMEVELASSVVQISMAADGSNSVVKPHAEERGDSEMAGVEVLQVVKEEGPHPQESNQETLPIEPPQVIEGQHSYSRESSQETLAAEPSQNVERQAAPSPESSPASLA